MLTDNERWLLTEAAKSSGLTPNAASSKEFAISLETRGWVRASNNDPVWYITDAGRAALADSK